MGDAELTAAIKQTQESLGKYVKKPPLTENNLKRPPFRFIHDVTTSAMKITDFLSGVFTPEELDSNNVVTREAKTEFMRKLINAVNEASGEDVQVKIAKILAGQEAVNTNILLQAFAVAIEKTKGSKTAASSSSKTDAKAKPGSLSTKGTAASKAKVESKTPAKSDVKNKASVDKKAPSTTVTGSKSQPSKQSDAKTSKPTPPAGKDKPQESSVDKKRSTNGASERRGSVEVKSSEGGSPPLDQTVTKKQSGSTEPAAVKASGLDNEIEHGLNSEGDANLLESNASATTFDLSHDIGKVSPDGNMSNFSGPASHETEHAGPTKSTTGFGEVDNRDGRQKVGSRLSTAGRPPSARPAPPRPKSSMVRDMEEISNYRPPTGKVTNVMLETSEGDEDDNFVVREASVAPIQSLSNVDETPELALITASTFDDENALEELTPTQRGLLVDQILETQKELETKDDDKTNVNMGKSKEATKAEIEKLKNLLQTCAKNANPLARLLDYVREDIETMQTEIGKWREESKTLDVELENVKKTNETSLQPLQQQLTDAEARIADKEDAIIATKMSIIRIQERIQKILLGLDRVQSSHGKITLPSASQLLQPNFNNRDRSLGMNNNMNIHGGGDAGFSSGGGGFGGGWNQSTTPTPINQPKSTNMFAAMQGDLDPDSFDPFKS